MLASIFALALLPLSALSLTVNNPSTTVTSGGNLTITWSSTTSDPSTFLIELSNVDFNSQFAIANNVNTSLNTITVELPEVNAGSGFTIQFVNIENNSQIYAETSDFSIASAASGSAASTVAATTATGSAASTASVASTATASASLSVSGSVTVTVSSSTRSATSTRAASSSGSSSSSSSSASSSSNAASTLQVGGAGILAAVLGWAVAL